MTPGTTSLLMTIDKSANAKACGVEPDTFVALCEAMPEGDRRQLRDLCCSDLATAGRRLEEACRQNHRDAQMRQLHVIISLGGTAGAKRLVVEASKLQDVLRSGERSTSPEAVQRVVALINCACEFFGTIEIDENGHIR